MALSTLYLAVLLLSLGHAELTDSPPGDSCSAGVPGSPGLNGHNGQPGRDGRDGKDGATGPKGDRGEPGVCESEPGPPGKMGPVGLPGKMGSAGPAGPRGEKGDTGLPGDVQPLQTDIDAILLRIALVEKAASFRVFRKVGAKYYVTEGLQGSYDAGLKFCREAGGDLVVPQNETENDVLLKMLTQLGAKIAWLGFTDRKTEGTFLDSRGSSLSFTKWRSGEPNDGGSKGEEDCGMMYVDKYNGLWNDVECDRNYHIVCEITN
ncbi:pulmonary surfactant-associated protein D-like [Engraulis encrasicolus]|uniref:pulmonary surfactant-associated protein D-like n=1 Tax=Engraulis encrasicolus TaxID=184585 RepID=UPI002FD417F4